MPPHRILIVDDQRDIRELLRASLDYLGLELNIVDVPSGEEGMLVISHQKFDLLVTDVRLAGMSGLELVRKVKMRNPDLRVILITGMIDSEVRQQVAEFGAEAFFYKPLDIADFQSAVMRCLEESEIARLAPPARRDAPPFETTPPTPLGLIERLEMLRQNLGAQSVWISDQNGEVIVRMGEIPEGLDTSPWQRTTATALATSIEIALSLAKPFPDNYLAFTGLDYDLHMVNLGWSYALLGITGRALSVAQTSPMRVMQDSAGEILPALAQYLESKLVKPASDNEAALDEALQAGEEIKLLDDAFRQVSQMPVDTQELDNFWEAVLDGKETGSPAQSGSLNYDQARRLGLAPRD